MKVAIFGAGGILGQTMRLYQPTGVDVRYYRRTADWLHCGVELTQESERDVLLERFVPDVILNLAGENNPDEVERHPATAGVINRDVPGWLAKWCDENDSHYVHVSTQGVFYGEDAPYGPSSRSLCPVNRYGAQKVMAEETVRQHENWTIVRPTFVMGVRPIPSLGRPNPAEQMLDGQYKQVNDRWFSPLFARDASRALWYIVKSQPKQATIHLGTPARTNRYLLAEGLGMDPHPVSHDSFEGLAPRPLDTSYATDSMYESTVKEGLAQCRRDWEQLMELGVEQRAREIALFLGITEAVALERLSRGFIPNHHDVAADYRAANPQDDDALLEWYRTTESYIWELSAYHVDEGFNYKGTCKGVCDHMRGAEGQALVLGDGIGDLTLKLRRAEVDAVYHDLGASRTVEFAMHRLRMYLGRTGNTLLSSGWEPPAVNPSAYETVLCLDFLEHVTDVPAWLRAIFVWLKPGGTAMFQNAFNVGSGEDGTIPMHLARNDRYEKEWTPLMAEIGFRQVGRSNWWAKDA